MPLPDIFASSDLVNWLAELHRWLLAPEQARSLDELASQAGISAPHLHNLLTGRRRLLPRHAEPLGRAVGMDQRQIEELARRARGDAPPGAGLRPTGRLDEAVLAELARTRQTIRDVSPTLWAPRAWVWTLDGVSARRVFEAGVDSLRHGTPVHAGARVTVLLRSFPVSTILQQSAAEADLPALVPLTPLLRGDNVVFNMNADAASPDAPDILDFLDYREFLVRWHEHRRAARPRLSTTSLARRFGVSVGHIRNVLARRRGLDPAVAGRAASRLDLDDDRARYLPLLIAYNDSKDPLGALHAWQELSLIRARHGRPLDHEASSPLLLRWYLPVVLALSTTPEWREDPAWIAATVRPAIAESTAMDALRLLRAAGYLPGGPAQTAPVVRTPEWLPDAALLRFHHECLDVATDAARLGLEPWLFRRVTVAVDAPPDVAARACSQRWADAVEREANQHSDGAHDQRAHLFLAYAVPESASPP